MRAALDRMHARVTAAPELITRRKALVEHPFGTMKFWSHQQAFLMRGLERVRAEWSLSTLCYNIRRVLKIVDFEKLLEAVRRRAARKIALMPAPASHPRALWQPFRTWHLVPAHTLQNA